MEEIENKCICNVEQIRSYQTLVYKNGYRTFPKTVYKAYKHELEQGMKKLKPISDNKSIQATLVFNLKESVDHEEYAVKMIKTGNTSRKFRTEKEAKAYMKEDRHYIEFREEEIKYGSIGDNDNIMKPILDLLEDLGIISNDRFIVDTRIIKTFNNKENTIEIGLKEMEVVIREDGVYTFK